MDFSLLNFRKNPEDLQDITSDEPTSPAGRLLQMRDFGNDPFRIYALNGAIQTLVSSKRQGDGVKKMRQEPVETRMASVDLRCDALVRRSPSEGLRQPKSDGLQPL